MRIIAMILRVLLVLVWIKMMSISGWTPDTAPFCSGVGFILAAVYFALLSIAGPKKMLCPLFHGCKWEPTCKK